jgi:hypothetical protein
MKRSEHGTFWLNGRNGEYCIAVVPAGGKLILEAV